MDKKFKVGALPPEANKNSLPRWREILASLKQNHPPKGWTQKGHSAADWKPTIENFAEAGLASSRTISRDLDVLKRMNQVAYDSSKRAWKHTGEGDSYDHLSIGIDEMHAFQAMLWISKEILDKRTYNRLSTLLSKLEELGPNELIGTSEIISKCLTHKSSYIPSNQSDTWFNALTALIAGKDVSFRYRPNWSQKPDDADRKRYVPLQLAFINDAWYLYARGVTESDDKRRPYRLSRIRDLKVLQHKSNLGIDIEKLKSEILIGWGAFMKADSNQDICRIKISKDAHRFFAEKKWADPPTVMESKDGEFIYEITIPSKQEIIKLPVLSRHPFVQFLLSWSQDIEVLEPKWLRVMLANIAKEERKKYSS